MNDIEKQIAAIKAKQLEIESTLQDWTFPFKPVANKELNDMIAKLEAELRKLGLLSWHIHADGIGFCCNSVMCEKYKIVIKAYSFAASGDTSLGGCASELAGKNEVIYRLRDKTDGINL